MQGIALSADGHTLATAGEQGRVIIWDLMTGQAQRTLVGHTRTIAYVALSEDGRTLVSDSTSASERVKVWDVETGQERCTLGEIAIWEALTLSADGQRLASGSEFTALEIWDLASGNRLHVLPAPVDTLCALAFLDENHTLLSGSEDGSIILWDLATEAEQQTFMTSPGGLRTLALSRDGRTLVTAEADGRLMVWRRDES
jgi:WD40 repeat protein